MYSFVANRFGNGNYGGHPTIELVFDNGAASRKSFTGSGDEFSPAANPTLQRWQHPGAERLFIGAILQQFHDRLVTVKVGNDGRRKGVAEFLFHYLGIGVSDTKGDERSYVTEDSLAHC